MDIILPLLGLGGILLLPLLGLAGMLITVLLIVLCYVVPFITKTPPRHAAASWLLLVFVFFFMLTSLTFAMTPKSDSPPDELRGPFTVEKPSKQLDALSGEKQQSNRTTKH